MFVGSDASALYPSFTARMKGAAVRKAILKTKIESITRSFILCRNCSRLKVCEAGLRRVVHVRAKHKGAKPGEAVMGLHKEKNDKQWLFSRVGSSSE